MQHNPSGTLMQQFCQQPISHRLWSQLCPQVKCRGFSHHSKSLPITLHSWCKHPKRLEPVSNMTENMEITEESKGRQDLFARFPGYLCALLAILQACSIQHVLSRGSWLLTQKLCKFLGWSIGRQRQSPWKKKHARTVFMLLFTIIAWGCHWLMTASTLRISSTCSGQKKPMQTGDTGNE